jgi:hypothetical protein
MKSRSFSESHSIPYNKFRALGFLEAPNRLKTLKRAMFGRAGIELLRARMLPLQ